MLKAVAPAPIQTMECASEGICRTIVVTRHCPPAMKKRDIWRIEQFHLVRKLGSGYASTVYLATCRHTGNQVAIKMYHKTKLSELNHYQVQREVRIHCNLEHQHIVQLWAAFEDQYGLYLVTEYASKGDVFTEVEKRGGQMSEADAVKQVLHPFLLALDYLHLQHIIHRDIKPENLLFTATGALKVGDFGLSINYEEERPVTRVGTLDYMAPEVVVCPDKHRPQDHKEMTHLHYNSLVDSWAIGVLAYELIVGRPPFDKGHKKATIAEILNGEPVIPPWMSDGAAHFIRWALTKESSKRPTVVQLAQHPWILHHVNAPRLQTRRLIERTDSYVEPRAVGMALHREGSGPEELIRHLQTQAAQTGRFLGKSNSLNAMDGLRYRDFDNPANAIGATGFTPPASFCTSPTGSSGNLAGMRTEPHERPWNVSAAAATVKRVPSTSRLAKPHSGFETDLATQLELEGHGVDPKAFSRPADASRAYGGASSPSSDPLGRAGMVVRSNSATRIGGFGPKDMLHHSADYTNQFQRCQVQKSKSFIHAYDSRSMPIHKPSGLQVQTFRTENGVAFGGGELDLNVLNRTLSETLVHNDLGAQGGPDLRIRSFRAPTKEQLVSGSASNITAPPSPLSRCAVRTQSFNATSPSAQPGGPGAAGSPSRWLHRLSKTNMAMDASMDGESSGLASPEPIREPPPPLPLPEPQVSGQNSLVDIQEGDVDMVDDMNCDESNPDQGHRLLKGAKGLFSSFKKVFS